MKKVFGFLLLGLITSFNIYGTVDLYQRLGIIGVLAMIGSIALIIGLFVLMIYLLKGE